MHADFVAIVLAVGIVLAVSPTAVAGEQHNGITLFVATNGNDAWSGTLAEANADGTDGPLATLQGARDAIRRMRGAASTGEVNVLLREGVYRIEEPLVLEPQDSGTWDAHVTYTAYEDERAVISGGRRVTGWRQEGDLWVAELPEVKAGNWWFSALFVDCEYRTPARTPNEDFFYTAGKLPEGYSDGGEGDFCGFQFNPGDIQHWQNLEDATVVVMHSWDTSYHPIRNIDDDHHIVTFPGKTGWAFEHWGPRQRYYVKHVFEALDQPGEWYLNRKTGMLYYRPMPGEDMADAQVIAPVAPQLVVFKGDLENGRFVEYVYLKGLAFQDTEFTLGPNGQGNAQAASPVHGAIHADGAHYCVVENCEVAHISNYGVWFRQGCRYNRVVHNHVHDMGAGGVRIGHTSDPSNAHYVTSWNEVDNNWIHDGGKIFPAAVGVWVGRSSYNRVSHNEISDLFYTGVSVGWSWGYAESSANHNVIEYNHIHHIGKWILSDMGGIYTLGVAPGTILRYNLIHDVFSYAYGGWGIYPDEGSTDLLIENNVVYNTKTGTFHQHYGRENRVVNNIFAFSHEGQIIRSREEEHLSFLFERNIVYFNNGQLLGSNWSNGNFWCDRNCYWDTSDEDIGFAGNTFDEWRAKGNDVRSIIADPGFKDPEAFDFRLKPNSPALEVGFRPIDISKAGLYGEKAWVRAPKKVKREPSELPEPRKPEPIIDDFEDTAVGEAPKGASVSGQGEGHGIRVTDEVAASGKHGLQIQDAAGLQPAYNPHMYYRPHFRKGSVQASFDIRLGADTLIYHEWRDAHSPYRVGPSLWFHPDGRLTASGTEMLTLPRDQWIHITVTCPLGVNAGAYSVEVGLPDGKRRVFKDIPCVAPAFQRLEWCGFVSNGDKAATAYLDNLRIEAE